MFLNSDPFVRLSFGIRSATSKTINKKLNPRWDQMLVLESVPIYGHPDQIVENPPDVVLELFDWDLVVRLHTYIVHNFYSKCYLYKIFLKYLNCL